MKDKIGLWCLIFLVTLIIGGFIGVILYEIGFWIGLLVLIGIALLITIIFFATDYVIEHSDI